MSGSDGAVEAVTFVRRRQATATIKKKADGLDETESVVIRQTAGGAPAQKLNPLVQGTRRAERAATDAFAFESDRSATNTSAVDNATRVLDVETAHDRDGEAVYKRSLEIAKSLEGKEDDKVYRGQAGYAQYTKKNERYHGGGGGHAQGPLRASSHVRISCRFDYQPDLCKDWKETGFCGYGDNCKFMHDRGDYKTGWQLERDWDSAQKALQAKKRGLEEATEVAAEDDTPFACWLCRDGFTEPVVTRCQHYFCEKCILGHNKLDPKCPVCGENMLGVFNAAIKLRKKLKQDGPLQKKVRGDTGDKELDDQMEEAYGKKRSADQGWTM